MTASPPSLDAVAERLRRHGAWERLSWRVGHDLSNLLTAVMLNADALIRGLGAGHPLTPRARDILAAAQQGAAVLKELTVRAVPPPLPSPAAEGPRPARILLVEDDGLLRELLAETLAAAGYRVEAAARVAQALELLEAEGDAIDLVLTDLVMPGGLGTELGCWMAAHPGRTRLLYMSGHAADPELVAAARAAAATFLPKPFATETLLAKVGEALAGEPPGG